MTRENQQTEATALKKCPTSIFGFKEDKCGGLPESRPAQVCTRTSSGKTLFATVCIFLMLFYTAKAYSQLTTAAEGYNLNNHSLLFLGNETLPPMIYLKNDKPVGIVVDLAEALKERMARPVRFKYMHWTQAQQHVLEGKADALLQINPTEERKKIYDFSDSLLESEFSIFISFGREGVYDITGLRGLKVGVEEKGLPIIILKQDPLIKSVVIPDILRGFHLLTNGVVDAVVVDRWVGSFVLAEHNIRGIRIAGEAIDKSNSAVAVKRGNTQLLAEINKALSEIKEDGTYKDILSKWQSKEVIFQTKDQYYKQKIILTTTLCVLIVTIIWGIFLLTEIKKRKKTEEALVQSEAFLNAAGQIAKVGGWEIDGEAQKVFWTKEIYKITEAPPGYDPSSQEKGAIVFFNEKDQLTLEKAIQRAFEDSEPYNMEFLITTAKGNKKWVQAICEPIVVNGKVVRLGGTFQDITERKQAEEELQESEERYRSLIELNPDGIFVSREGKIIYVNQAAIGIWGAKSEDELIGKTVFDLIHPDYREKAKQRYQLMLEKGVSVPFSDFIFLRLDKGETHAQAIASPVIFKGETAILTAVRDITDLKNAEAEKEKLEAQLQQAQKMESIGTLAGGIAHDFNNILSPIMIHSEMALMELPAGSPVRHSLKEIYTAGERASEMVKQILIFSRKEEGKRAEIKIAPVLMEVLKMLRSTMPTTIDIQQNLEAESDTVFADPTQIHQIMLNLGTNAHHAMRKKGGIMKVSLVREDLNPGAVAQYSDLDPGSYLKLSVSDSGSGIDDETMQKILEPYFTTKGPGEGTGMGLALIHGIVKSYDGDITVESEPGKGTTFNVYLPRIEAEVSPGEEPSVQIPRGTERILFVDDEKSAVDAVQPMLENLGYNVTARTSSIDALEAFKSDPNGFDLVITDHTMPNMTGKDLAKELMSIRSDILIILCTGFSEQIDEVKAREMGISFVMKPIVLSQIANTIRNVLNPALSER